MRADSVQAIGTLEIPPQIYDVDAKVVQDAAVAGRPHPTHDL